MPLVAVVVDADVGGDTTETPTPTQQISVGYSRPARSARAKYGCKRVIRMTRRTPVGVV